LLASCALVANASCTAASEVFLEETTRNGDRFVC
jgi:hypothetical protein